MKLKNWYNKTFNKAKVVKVSLLGHDRKVSTHYVVPHGNSLTITRNDVQHVFMFKPEHIFTQKKFNTGFAVEGQAELVRLNTFKAEFHSEDFAVAMNNTLAADFVRANQKEKPNILMFLVLASIGLGIITLYYLFQMQSELRALVPSTTQFITTLLRR